MALEPQRSGGASDGQRSADDDKMPPPGSGRIDATSVGHLQQSGHLVMGPGARRDSSTGTTFLKVNMITFYTLHLIVN